MAEVCIECSFLFSFSLPVICAKYDWTLSCVSLNALFLSACLENHECECNLGWILLMSATTQLMSTLESLYGKTTDPVWHHYWCTYCADIITNCDGIVILMQFLVQVFTSFLCYRTDWFTVHWYCWLIISCTSWFPQGPLLTEAILHWSLDWLVIRVKMGSFNMVLWG